MQKNFSLIQFQSNPSDINLGLRIIYLRKRRKAYRMYREGAFSKEFYNNLATRLKIEFLAKIKEWQEYFNTQLTLTPQIGVKM